MNQNCQKLKHDKIYDQSCLGNFWVFWIQQKWPFGGNLDTRICMIVVLPHLKKNPIWSVLFHLFPEQWLFLFFQWFCTRVVLTRCWCIVLPTGNGMWSTGNCKSFFLPQTSKNRNTLTIQFYLNVKFLWGLTCVLQYYIV